MPQHHLQCPRLNQQNLSRLPDDIARPTYDRAAVTAGIVHVGVGGFHRSHAAWYTDRLLAGPDASEWGICGVGLFEGDRRIANVLREQDHLYTLMVKHPDGRIEHRVIGSLVDFLLAVDDPAAVIDRMADPHTKIVSLTITEGGYNFDAATGTFNFDHPDVQHELAHPGQPRTVFGYLTAALRQRRASGHDAFTVQSCDNVQHNGHVARNMLLAFAGRQDADLATWIEAEVRFPNAMVDRITPGTTDDDRAAVAAATGLHDAWPVTCEPFCQWVIEDQFSAGRPAWESVGARFVPDVTPYETMKLRLLNAGHSVLGLLGSLHGHPTIDVCVNDPQFARFLRHFMDVEATPQLPRVAGIDLDVYKDTLIKRFGNPNIKDSLVRICLESSAKLPKFLLPTAEENLKNDGPVEAVALTIAAWCYYSDRRQSQSGEPLEIIDVMADQLHAAAAGTADDPLSFLRLEPVFGTLADPPGFTEPYRRWIQELYAGTPITRAMQQLLSEQG